MINLCEKKFFENATAVQVSETFNNFKGDTVTLQVYADNDTTFSIKIQGKVDINSDWQDLALIDLKTLSVVDNIEDLHLYQTSISGITQIRAEITAINGTLNLFARITE